MNDFLYENDCFCLIKLRNNLNNNCELKIIFIFKKINKISINYTINEEFKYFKHVKLKKFNHL